MGQLYSAVTPFPNHKTSLVSPDQSYSDSEESEDTFDESNTEDDPVEAAADRFLRERAYQRAAELYGVKYDTISHDLPVEEHSFDEDYYSEKDFRSSSLHQLSGNQPAAVARFLQQQQQKAQNHGGQGRSNTDNSSQQGPIPSSLASSDQDSTDLDEVSSSDMTSGSSSTISSSEDDGDSIRLAQPHTVETMSIASSPAHMHREEPTSHASAPPPRVQRSASFSSLLVKNGRLQFETSQFRWQKGALIGSGSFGRVHLGLNLDTGEMIAVKQVNLASEKLDEQSSEIQALQHEISILIALQHENIVRYLGSSVEDNTFNIFLEYVPGGSIASLIRKFGHLPESLIRIYTKQILVGLQYLHQHKIIHRDIKGANILVDNKGIIKLADFGASKRLEGLISAGGVNSLKGTIFWMAPEVIRQTGYGRQADIWSLGCTVIEMATGKPPWSGEFSEQISALFNIATTTDPPPLPDYLSEDAKHFLTLCFLRNPRERPSATKLLKHPFIVKAGTETYVPQVTPPRSPIEAPSIAATQLLLSHLPKSAALGRGQSDSQISYSAILQAKESMRQRQAAGAGPVEPSGPPSPTTPSIVVSSSLSSSPPKTSSNGSPKRKPPPLSRSKSALETVAELLEPRSGSPESSPQLLERSTVVGSDSESEDSDVEDSPHIRRRNSFSRRSPSSTGAVIDEPFGEPPVVTKPSFIPIKRQSGQRSPIKAPPAPPFAAMMAGNAPQNSQSPSGASPAPFKKPALNRAPNSFSGK